MDKLKELETRITDLEKRFDELEKDKIQVQGFSKVEEKLFEITDDIMPQDLVVIALRLNGNLSRTEIKKTIQDWGCNKKTIGWFKGGNFKQRLIDQGIIISTDKDEKNKDIFSLTKIKGIKKSNEIFKKYSLN
ncbi:MAG: hypothetical protein OER82_02055 [Nitrosopumilus sp.]|nr:hypothetical protein [Nitrosopumilus sp.]